VNLGKEDAYIRKTDLKIDGDKNAYYLQKMTVSPNIAVGNAKSRGRSSVLSVL